MTCTREDHASRLELNFDDGWLFHRGALPGGEDPSLDDRSWDQIDLPHDWSIADLPGTNSPFDSTVINGVASGFTRGGTAWYRKYFTIPRTEKGERILIRFDGVYKNSDVWVNGAHIGNHYYGYTGFQYDVTDFVNFSGENLLAVKVNNDAITCRWYSGSGIYRHVWLISTPALHFDPSGLYITTTGVSEERAAVNIQAVVRNQSGEARHPVIRFEIVNAENKVVAAGEKGCSVQEGERTTLDQVLEITEPELWDPDSPYLYRLVAGISQGMRVMDTISQKFGIRSISFDAAAGFRLNGKVTELRGGCMHHDNGPLGARAYDRAEERKIELLKAAGFNAVRFAHNPPSREILDACDRLGVMAVDEAFDVWQYGKLENDYSLYFDSLWRSDLKSMILRDRNHPSIIMWSTGNEIRNAGSAEVASVCDSMSRLVHSLDPTRPVTAAVNHVSRAKDPFLSHLDVCGYNYAAGLYTDDHLHVPERVMYGSESYPPEAWDYWQGVKDNSWVIGDFVWTAFDYLGEASIGWRGYPQKPDFYPWHLAYCGDLDVCGSRRPQSYYRQTIWDDKPVAFLFVKPPRPSFPLNPEKAEWSKWDWPDVVGSWNFEGYESTPLLVSAYTNCEEAELFLNGMSLGRKKNTREDKNIIQWSVPYQPGELKITGYTGNETAAGSVLKTAGNPVEIRLTADRDVLKADGQDLSFIIVGLIDSNGIMNPGAENRINFTIRGPGEIMALANADPTSTESFRGTFRKAWRGRCLAIVRSGKDKGEIRLGASADGFVEKEIVIKAE